MLRPPSPDAVFEFGEFRFEPGNSRLVRAGEVVAAQPKALRVLGVLVENAGDLVDREALFELVWDRTIVTEGAQTRLVRQLRRLLGDDADRPRFIETIYTRGYRWIAPVSRVGIAPRRSNLPEPSVELIGREADLGRLEQLLSKARLVTLAGPGGSGKTQLALELGRRLVAAEHSVAWADLSSAVDALQCNRLVAAALDAREREDLSLEAGLARAIGSRELVLLLDNCEVVVHPVVSLAKTLLSQCPSLRLVCTSQVTLDVPAEKVHWVNPLAAPGADWSFGDDPVSELLGFDAARLFAERASAVTPQFQIDRDNAGVIAEVCRRLDGLPLALELAAPRLATLTPQQLLDAIDDRFALLERRVARPETRFRSLSAAIEWSYGLLDAREQDVLDCFSAFVAPFSIDAAQAVAASEAGGSAGLLNVIQSLTQKSLLVPERSEREIRYRLLDSVKAFARSRLRVRGREREIEARHAAHFVALARAANAHLLSSDQLAWLARLVAAWPDLTATYDWLLRPGGSVADARTLVTGLRWCFWIRGNYGEALQWFRGWRELGASAPPAERASLFNGVAIALFYARRDRDAAEAATLAAAAAQDGNVGWELSLARSLLEWIAALGPAAASPAEALPEGDPTHRGDPWLRAFSRLGPAFKAMVSGERSVALTELGTMLALIGEGDPHLRMYVIAQQILLHYLSGRLPEARRAILQHYEIARQLSNPRALTTTSESTAYLSIAAGDPELGARLLGAAEQGRDATGAPHFPQWYPAHADAVARALRALGEREFEVSKAAGRKMGPREAAALAIEANTAALARQEPRPRGSQRS